MEVIFLVSIIVPVYNGERYLQRCLDSIRHQTYKDFEAIIIDDGSTDDTADICDKMARIDSRFCVIHQNNAGISAARNAGLERAKGDVAFIDADDWVETDYIEKLKRGLDYPKVDISYCMWHDEYAERIISMGKTLQNRVGTQDANFDAQDYDWNGELDHPMVWGCIFRKKILKGLAFDKRFYVGEDSLFFTQCLKRARKLYFVHDTVYHHVHYQQSAYHGSFDAKKFTEIYAWEEICKIYYNTNIENKVITALAARVKLFCIKYYSDPVFLDSGCLEELINKYRDIQDTYFKELNRTKKYKELITSIAFGICPKLYLWVIYKRKSLLLK